MTPVAVGLSLAFLSALATAWAHAMLKAGADKLAVQAWVRLTGLSVALPIALFIGLPPNNLWPWIIGGAAIHGVYQAALVWSYSVSDFSVAYPVARGVTPILTALLGMAVLGDEVDWRVMAGVLIVSVGIISISRNNAISRSGLVAASIAGLLTTLYTVVDARGVRLAPYALTFIAWFYVADGLSMPMLLLVKARGRTLSLLVADRRTGLMAGILSMLAFVPALFAFDLAPVGAVAAIRETSVIISLALGGFLLKEKLDRRRAAGAVLVTLGALAIIIGTT